MNSKQNLLNRLEAIGQSLEQSQHALALIGLGSVGTELERMDEYSDLDFFAIVEVGYKTHYIQDLSWLSHIAPVAYQFQNTVDGHKLLYADGIFCEFAVFELHELERIPFAAGRIVWKKSHVNDAIATPIRKSSPSSTINVEWQLGEALTNLLIGLERFQRGEKLSGSRFVQHYALDRVLELTSTLEHEQPHFKDEFVQERRFEQRFPKFAAHLPNLVQGYEHTPESALAILEFLEQHFEVNTAIAKEIRALGKKS
jgi:lincosamide nucleotidyltransferase B/F